MAIFSHQQLDIITEMLDSNHIDQETKQRVITQLEQWEYEEVEKESIAVQMDDDSDDQPVEFVKNEE